MFFRIYLFILCFSLTFATTAYAGQKLSKRIERVANNEYFLNELADFMFDNSFDAKNAFKCRSISSSAVSDGGKRIACNNKSYGLLTIETFESGGEKSSVRLCKPDFSQDRVFLKSNSFDERPAEAYIGRVGTQYYMGRTNGWFRDYENIYAELGSSGSKISCWFILRR